MSVIAQYAPYALRDGARAADRRPEAFGDAVVAVARVRGAGDRQARRPGARAVDLERVRGSRAATRCTPRPALDQFFVWRPLLGHARYRIALERLPLRPPAIGGGITGGPGQNAARARRRGPWGERAETRPPTPPIILVPGFWLGAWAWDEVADAPPRRRPRRHRADRPGPESGRRPLASVTFEDHVDAIVDAVEAAGTGRPRRPQRDRLHRVRGQRPRPGADRGDGLRRHRARQGRSTRLRGRREAARLGGDRGRGEPRRASPRRRRRRSASGPSRSGRGRPGRYEFTNDARATSRARSSRRASRRPTTRSTPAEHPSGRSSPASRSCGRDLDRPADQPLADVVEAGRAEIIGNVANR